MPITRRRRANPPEQPENNNPVAEQSEHAAEESVVERPAEPGPEAAHPGPAVAPINQPPLAIPARDNVSFQSFIPPPALTGAPIPPANGDRAEPRPERPEPRQERDYTPTIEGGRRTARGELFRRPPQAPIPAQPGVAAANAAPLPPPTREISLPLGNLLHLAYNPGYTGSEEARSALLQQLEQESKAGGRARCWSCGSLAIAYDRWNTRSKSFGEVGVAFCEICGVWSVM